jgi:tetratricopeptide (TPR) repeat protein
VPSVTELLSKYEDADSLVEAEQALDELQAACPPADLELGDLFDGLAEAAAECDDFALAVRAQRRALELGCDYPEIAREMLAWYLLKAGRRKEGEEAFAELRAERGEDPELLVTLANARMDSGDRDGAVEAFDVALASARGAHDDEWAEQIRGERRSLRAELGLEPDEDDRLSDSSQRPDSESRVRLSLAWFPRAEMAAARAHWPSLADDLGDPDSYCRAIESRLRTIRERTGKRPTVAPLRVESLMNYADGHGLSADDGATRSRFSAELDRRGETIAWPSGRNEPCWCGSGLKYKRCCGETQPTRSSDRSGVSQVSPRQPVARSRRMGSNPITARMERDRG